MAPVSPIKGMDFARKQLLKYGWKEGKGLGRSESGIVTAIKPKLKFDKQGIGHDESRQFTSRWWEHAFNKAASNIHVDTDKDGVSVRLKNDDDDDLDIATKKYSKLKLKKDGALEYGAFRKTSTLTEGGQMVRTAEEIPESEQTADFETLTDEDLFKICGGCTAHKGARHGLKLNGKLARIEKQEELLMKMTNRDRNSDENENVETKKKKNKKKKKKKAVEDEGDGPKRKKEKLHRPDSDGTSDVGVEEPCRNKRKTENEDQSLRKKKKKKHSKEPVL
ncbi:hypothetical protein C0J52_10446 [Blattella germanica]|nr:hypothetical protein C0J52_10446 [Blattella germanica]